MSAATTETYTGGYPLATGDDVTAALKSAYEQANEKAKRLWNDFDDARTKAIQDGSLTKDAKVAKNLDGLHKSYEAAATESIELRERYLTRLEETSKQRTLRQPEASGADGLGRWMAAEFKSLMEGSGSGSYIVPPHYLGRVWDRLAAQSVGLRSGFTIIETERDELHIPRLTADAAANWTAEGNAITTSDPTLDEVVAMPRKLAALVQMSNEIIADSNPDVLEVVSENLLRALALKLDLGFFEGSGTAPEIRGLKNVSGTQAVSMGTNGAALANLDPFADAISALEQENALATAIVCHPRTWKAVLKLKETTTSIKPLVQDEIGGVGTLPRRSLYGVPVYLTSQLSIAEIQGTANNASSAYVYQGSQVVAVRRWETRIELDRSRLFNQDMSEMRAILRYDLAVPNPKAVCRIVGIIP